MSPATHPQGQIPLELAPADWQVNLWQEELRRAYADLHLLPRRMSFDEAMAHPVLVKCIRNIAHARLCAKGRRRA